MKTYIFLIFLSISFITNSKAQDTYNLKWKINDDEKIAYLTETGTIDSAIIDLPEFFKTINNVFKDKSDSVDFDLNNFFKSFYSGIEKYSMMSVLQKQGEWINIKSIVENLNDTSQNSDSGGFMSMMKGIQLRGLLNQNGEIQSFYTKRDQKNLISIFFQLPSKPVRIGEKWSLDVNWITMDQNFECDSMKRTNEVELIDVRIDKRDTIAIIKYNFNERVKGNFNLPFGNKSIETMYDWQYNAICEFSITNGKWINYSGISTVHSTGFQNTSFKQRFALVEKKVIPKVISKYLD